MRWFGLLSACLTLWGLCALGQDLQGTSAGELLKPTTAAPVGAQGTITIEGSMLTLEIQRLKPGPYQIAINQSSNAQPRVLGVINIPDLDLVPSREAGGNNQGAPGGHQTQRLVCKAQLQLPADVRFSPTTQFLVMDRGGTVLLQSGVSSPRPSATSFQFPTAR